MSKQPDWEEGPQDATHWCAESDQFLESWYKLDDRGSWFCIAAGSWKWCSHRGSDLVVSRREPVKN